MVIIDSKYAIAVRNIVRDTKSDSDKLKKCLTILGQVVGQEIATKYLLTEKTIITPMDVTYSGLNLVNDNIVVVSTADDYEWFGKGIASRLQYVKQGYIDFGGVRGTEALTASFRSITLPDVNNVKTVIIAKSVMATGCTATTLAKKAMEKYWPEQLIVATVFYSNRGYIEFMNECKTAEVFTIGEPDEITSDGMLTPGIGNLDMRLKG